MSSSRRQPHTPAVFNSTPRSILMKRSISLLAVLLAVAYSSPTGPGPRPSWADNTSWKGSVTMKPGTTLNIAFHLTSALGPASEWSPQDTWHIDIAQPRIENVATGKVIGEAGAYTRADDTLKWVHFGMVADSAFDPLLPSCATAEQPGNEP